MVKVKRRLFLAAVAFCLLQVVLAASSNSGSSATSSSSERSFARLMADELRDDSSGETPDRFSAETYGDSSTIDAADSDPILIEAEALTHSSELERHASPQLAQSGRGKPKRKKQILTEKQRARNTALRHLRKAELVRLGQWDAWQRHIYNMQKKSRDKLRLDVPRYKARQARNYATRCKRRDRDPERWYEDYADRSHDFHVRRIRRMQQQLLKKNLEKAQKEGMVVAEDVNSEAASQRHSAALKAAIDASFMRSAIHAAQKAMDYARFQGALPTKPDLPDLNESAPEGCLEDDDTPQSEEEHGPTAEELAQRQVSYRQRGRDAYKKRIRRIDGKPGSSTRAVRLSEMNAALGAALGTSPKFGSWLRDGNAKKS